MKIIWKNLKNIEELDRKIWSIFPERNLQKVRQNVRIAVIDDKDFSPLPNLQSHQFNITHLRDLSTIDAIRDYQVVLIDLQGVGKDLNPTQEGAHLIREVKAHYPEKYVIAYTAGAAPELLVPSIQASDKFIRKDTSIEEWCDLLDNGTRMVAHPVMLWKKNRHRLLDNGITPLQLAYLEDALVRSLEEDPQSTPDQLEKKSKKLNLSRDVRSVIASLMANAMFYFLV